MAETYRFVDGVSYTEAQYMEYQKRLMSKNGVVANENLESATNELQVTGATPSAMSVLVKSGECFVQGEFYQNTADKTLTISASDASWNRYDRIVVGVDWSANTCGPYVLTGTAAASPSVPSLTQSAAKWEIPLYTLLVSAGVTDISGNDQTLLTDERYWCACNLGTFKLDTSGNLDASTNRIVNLHDPTGDQDADTPAARNAAIALVGGNWKAPVVAATTAAITLASDVENGDTLDGVTLATGDRILVKNQSDGGNGIYVVKASGAPDRATDFDSASDAWAAGVPVKGGTVNAGSAWRVMNATIANFGTTVLVFGRYALTQVGTSSVSGSITCASLFVATTYNGKDGRIVTRAGVYSFRCKNGPGVNYSDESSHAAQVHVNSSATNLAGGTVGGVGAAQDITLAVGDVVYAYINTIGTNQWIEIRNADGIPPW